MQSVRSGTHLERIGDVWYYRRVVPPDVRDAFEWRGKPVKQVRFSLQTKSVTEAKRLEKEHDVAFEAQLTRARTTGPDGHPRDRNARQAGFIDRIFKTSDGQPGWLERGLAELPAADQQEVREVIEFLADEDDRLDAEKDQFWHEELKPLILWSHESEEWAKRRAEIVELVRNYVEGDDGEHSIDWAYGEWVKAKSRPQQTQDDARRYLDDFKASAKVRMLDAVRRRHLTNWRDELKKDTALSATSINHRLEIVSAILRHGWREAEMSEVPDLSRINLPQEASGRTSWTRDELLTALAALEPHSWSAWVFVMAMTTGTRLGEHVAARREWWDPKGFIHVPASYTKMKKPHCLPIIGLVREPLARHIAGRNSGEFLFDAPRPSKPTLKISHEASKWFSRFFDRHQIDKVFHEIRHSWIQGARESPIKKEIYEIISGHSPRTVSDGYGGENPVELLKANERICRHFLDSDIRDAVRRLVA